MSKQSLKKALIIGHDLMATALAILLTCVFRFDGDLLDERLQHLPTFLPFFLAYAGVIYWLFALYQSKWRFASLPDLSNIVRASTVLALTLLVIDYLLVSPQIYGFFFFGKVAIGLSWLVQIVLLGVPRLAYRYVKYARNRSSSAREATTPSILIG